MLQLMAAYLQQIDDVFRYVGKLAFLHCIQRLEVIVDMFQTWFAQASYTINQLTGKVVALIVIEPFFEHRIVVQTTHGERAGALHLFDQLLLELHSTHCPAQSAQVLVQEGGDGAFEVVFRKLQYLAQLLAGVATQEFQNLHVVCALHQLLDSGVALFFLLAFLVHHLAAYQHEHCQADQCDNGDCAAEIDDQGHEETDCECSSGSDEPAADDAQYAGDAEYGGVASPSAVGKGGTHGHHEGDVGCGEGKFQGSTEGNQQAGEYKVDGGAYQVERCAVGNDGFVLPEAGFYPAFAAFGHRFGQPVGYCHAEAYQCTCYGGAAEALFAFILTGEVDGSLDYVMCLLGGAQRVDHDDSRTDKEIPGRFGRTQQRAHEEAVGTCGGAVGGVVDERGVAGKGHTDEVHQVVTRKGEGKGKGSQKHHDLEHVDLPPVQHLHQQGEEHKETTDQQGGVILYPLLVFRGHE